MKPWSAALLALLPLAALDARAEGAPPATPPATAPVEIPFVRMGGIYDWKAEGEQAILIETPNKKYYRATFMDRCLKLPYAEHIGFVTGALDTLDKFDSIVVGGEQCTFKDLTEIPKPPGMH